MAPGSHVLTLRPEAQYDFESGSSVAAAELTGVIALLMSAAHERLTPEAIVALLSAPEPGAITASATQTSATHASATRASAEPPSTAHADGAVARTVDVNTALDRLEQRAPGVTLLTH